MVLRIDPTSSSAHVNRGIVHAEKKDHGKAIADYNLAIRLDPKSAEPYRCRADAYRRQKKYGYALADYDRAIQIDPLDDGARVAIAWTLANCNGTLYADRARPQCARSASRSGPGVSKTTSAWGT